jgi:hypothetical protein
LFDDENGVTELLPLKETMHVTRENGQMFRPVSDWNDNSQFVSRLTFNRFVCATVLDSIFDQIVLETVVLLFQNGCRIRYVGPTNYIYMYRSINIALLLYNHPSIKYYILNLLNFGEIIGHNNRLLLLLLLLTKDNPICWS